MDTEKVPETGNGGLKKEALAARLDSQLTFLPFSSP